MKPLVLGAALFIKGSDVAYRCVGGLFCDGEVKIRGAVGTSAPDYGIVVCGIIRAFVSNLA